MLRQALICFVCLFQLCFASAIEGQATEELRIDVLKINGVTVAADENLRVLVISSPTGMIELDEGKGKVVVKVQTDTEVEQEIPFGLSDEERLVVRQKFLRQKFSSLRAIPRTDKLEAEILTILNAQIGRGDELKHIEVVGDQLARLREVSQKFDTQAKRISRMYAVVPEPKGENLRQEKYLELRESIAKEVSEILLPHQISLLSGWSPSELGIIKTITETPTGEVLGLSEKEIRVLRRETDRAIEELKAKETETRARIKKIYEDALDDRQRKLLKAQFGNLAEENLGDSSTSNFIRMMDYELESSEEEEEVKEKGGARNR